MIEKFLALAITVVVALLAGLGGAPEWVIAPLMAHTYMMAVIVQK